MANTNTTVGSAGTYPTMAAWETAVDSEQGTHTVTILEDIEGILYINAVNAVDWNAVIKGTRTGGNKVKWTLPSGDINNIVYAADANIVSIKFEDLELDGSGGSSAKSGINLAGVMNVEVKRCWIHGCDAEGIKLDGAGSKLIENCIISGNARGVDFSYVAAASTLTVKNTIVFGNTNHGIRSYNDANQTVHAYNSISMGNTHDFTTYTLSTVWVINCISEDTTAVSASHDDTTDSVGSQTAFADYFADYVVSDYHLKDTPTNLWGTAGSAVNTPADDYESVVRTNDYIGPYDTLDPYPHTDPAIVPGVVSSITPPIAYSPHQSQY